MESWKEELYHHGILGMKWGIRRYQNYDGTYTQKGLQRYRDSEKKYHEYDKKYQETKNKYEEKRASYDEVAKARRNRATAKRELSDDYKQVKRDYRADKGKAAYNSGKTVSGESFKYTFGAAAASAIGAEAARTFMKKGIRIRTKNNDLQIAANPAAVYLGSQLLAGAILAVGSHKCNDIRSYYSHSRMSESERKRRYKYEE